MPFGLYPFVLTLCRYNGQGNTSPGAKLFDDIALTMIGEAYETLLYVAKDVLKKYRNMHRSNLNTAIEKPYSDED